MRSPEDLKLAVKQGIYLLDAEVPDWREKIDIARLDLADPCRCILGQVIGEFFAALTALEITTHEAMAMGFECEHGEGRCEYDALEDLWLEELRR
jgi:hypothetical protein